MRPVRPVPEIETDRLLLRGWRDNDRDPYRDMRADPDVVRYLPGAEALVPLADEIADGRIKHFKKGWRRGYGVWAVEERASGTFVGYAGLDRVSERSRDVEVLYGFAKSFWGRGYAREAARAALQYGFETLGLERVVGFAVKENVASQRVLKAIGLQEVGPVDYGGFEVLGFAVERATGTPSRGAS